MRHRFDHNSVTSVIVVYLGFAERVWLLENDENLVDG